MREVSNFFATEIIFFPFEEAFRECNYVVVNFKTK